MILGQPLTQARWQQKVLFRKVRSLALAHDTLCTTPAPVPPAQSLLSTIRHSQTNRTSPTDYFSDTLLVGQQFVARGFFLKGNPAERHELIFAADSREVITEKLSGALGALPDKLEDTYGNRFTYTAFLESPFLNEQVNSDR